MQHVLDRIFSVGQKITDRSLTLTVTSDITVLDSGIFIYRFWSRESQDKRACHFLRKVIVCTRPSALPGLLTVWRSSGNVIGGINEVNLRRARLVLEWWPSPDGQTTSMFNQPPRPTQPPTLHGTWTEYRPKCDDALRMGSKASCGSLHCVPKHLLFKFLNNRQTLTDFNDFW